MDRKDKILIGALVPKDYAKELFDKLNRTQPRRGRATPMTYLVRTLLGLWFDDKIDVSPTNIANYKADCRENNRYGNQVIDTARQAGSEAAAQGMPEYINPHSMDSKSRAAWDEGWKSYFNKNEEPNGT